MNPALAAWAVEVVLITVRDLAGPTRRLPIPSELLSTFVVFGALAAIGGNPTARRPAAAVAWGIVVATFIGGYEKWSGAADTASGPLPSPPGSIGSQTIRSGPLSAFTAVSNFFAPSPPSRAEITQAAQNTR